MKNHGGMLGTSLLLASALTGCAAPDGMDDRDLSAGEHGLYMIFARSWAQLNNRVPLCWMTPGFAREKNLIQQAVAQTWAAESSLQFVFSSTCPTSGPPQVKLQIQAGNGGTANEGMEATLRSASDSNPSVTFFLGPSGSVSDPRVKYLGVHEIGHVLGFHHEQDRPENVDNLFCAQRVFPEAGEIQTLYDNDSVMSDCGRMDGTLSNRDKLGVRQVYARPRATMFARSTGDNKLWRTDRREDGLWSEWTDFFAGDISVPTELDVRYTRKGDVHLVAANIWGAISHTMRSPGGGWTWFSDVENEAGHIGNITTVALADDVDAMHVFSVTDFGGLYETARKADGAWTAMRDLRTATGFGGSFKSVGATAVGNDVHVCAVDTNGRLWLSIGVPGATAPISTWGMFGDVSNEIRNTTVGGRAFDKVDCVGASERLHIVARTQSDQVLHHIERRGTNWFYLGTVGATAGPPSTATDFALTQTRGLLQLTTAANAGLYHSTRAAGGSWTRWVLPESILGDRGTFGAVAME